MRCSEVRLQKVSLHIEFIYDILKMKFIYEGFSEFIYQGYIGVYLPKVHLRKPSLQTPYPNQYFPFLACSELREQISHKIPPSPPSMHPKFFIPAIHIHFVSCQK